MNAFDDDKDAGGTRSNAFVDLDAQHGVKPITQPQQGGAAGFFGNVAQTADDAIRAASDTMSFGLLDRALEATGAEPGAIEKTLKARERSPWATIAGDVGGFAGTMAATPLKMIGTGASALMGGARTGFRGALGRAGGYGVEGAATGAGQAAGHTYDLENLPKNVAEGAAIGGGVGGVLGPLTPRSAVASRSRAPVPTAAELEAAKSAEYELLRQNPASVYYSGVGSKAQDVKDTLHTQQFYSRNAPTTHEVLDIPIGTETTAARMGGRAVHSPAELEALRQELNLAGGEGKDAVAAALAKRELDAFRANPPAGSLSGGSPQAAQIMDELAQRARGNAGAQIRSKIIRDAAEAAESGAATSHSGRNVENTMRRAMARVQAQEGGGFSAAEREHLDRIAHGTDTWNALRSVGNMLGGGGGIGTFAAPVALGALSGGGSYLAGADPSTIAAFAVGSAGAGRGLRNLSNRAIRRNVNELDELVRSRSPEFASRQARDPGMVLGYGSTNLGSAARNEIANALIRREVLDKTPEGFPYYRPADQ
jgi:hypothetical protein